MAKKQKAESSKKTEEKDTAEEKDTQNAEESAETAKPPETAHTHENIVQEKIVRRFATVTQVELTLFHVKFDDGRRGLYSLGAVAENPRRPLRRGCKVVIEEIEGLHSHTPTGPLTKKVRVLKVVVIS
jgi:hypothetical protein